MRRGLKSCERIGITPARRRSKERPDEKGTEIRVSMLLHALAHGSKERPDEAACSGEACSAALPGGRVRNAPDEKGTEILLPCASGRYTLLGVRNAPMRRGLKSAKEA